MKIVGKITAVGSTVKKFKPGQMVGVGCMVDSCRTCAACKDGLEQYCDGPVSFTGTYGGPVGGGPNTYGGYSAAITVDQEFVLREITAKKTSPPSRRCSAPASPPGRRSNTGTPAPGKKAGIVGIGGLGHMGIKLAHALGAHVCGLYHLAGQDRRRKKLGADEIIISKDAQMKAHRAVST